MKKIILYIVAFIALNCLAQFIVPALFVLFEGGGTEGIRAMFTGESSILTDPDVLVGVSAFYSLASLLVFIRCGWAKLSPAYASTKPWGVLTWSALFALGALVPASLLEEAIPSLPDYSAGVMKSLLNSDFGYFALCLFAPFVEEVVFRGAVLRQLLAIMRHKWAAIAVSALIFALIHLNPAQMPYAFLAGLFLGWLYSRTRSILPGVVFHWVNNTLIYIICRLMPQLADGNISQLFGGDHRRVVLAVIFSLLILAPSLYQLNIRTRKAASGRA